MHSRAEMISPLETSEATVLPMTGEQYLESLRDGREIWIYGERVKDVTEHPGFRNSARMVARLYDALHDPATNGPLVCPTDTGNGGFTHPFFKTPTSVGDLTAARDAIAAWQRMTYGWMGRSPDYKASFLGMLDATADLYGPYAPNARRWYKKAQERVLHMNHGFVNPPVDRHRPPDEVDDVCVRVERETDAGLVVSGAKVVATGSALTNYTFVAPLGPRATKKEFCVVFIAPMGAPGVKLIARPSSEMNAAVMGSPFDYPLSSRFDENDSILIFDKVLIPWEDVFAYGDVDKANGFLSLSGFKHRSALHGCTRLAIKLDFMAGLMLKAAEATGVNATSSVRTNLGEVLAWRSTFWALSDALAATSTTKIAGAPVPNLTQGVAYQTLVTIAYPRIRDIISQSIASGLIYVNSHAVDFDAPELRPFIDRYIRGSHGMGAVDRVKLMKLLWDAVGSEFAGRHDLYERNYAGSYDSIRMGALDGAEASGLANELRGFASRCMSEYDLHGWTVPGLVSSDDVNVIRAQRLRNGELRAK
jgi:4-hydroxyphenylacetate 3-monooxygenase